jgi:hypothetical protein
VCGTKVLVRNDGIVMTEVQFSLSGHRISRPGLDGPPPPSRLAPSIVREDLSCRHRSGRERSRGHRHLADPATFRRPRGRRADALPPRPRRCPQPPESLQEVRSRLQPTVHVHTAAHDHGLVVIDPLNLFHRQHVRPRRPPRTGRPRWFGRSHQLTRAQSRRRPAPAGAESSMAALCPWLHNAASAQLPVGLNGPRSRAVGPRCHDVVRCGSARRIAESLLAQRTGSVARSVLEPACCPLIVALATLSDRRWLMQREVMTGRPRCWNSPRHEPSLEVG